MFKNIFFLLFSSYFFYSISMENYSVDDDRTIPVIPFDGLTTALMNNNEKAFKTFKDQVDKLEVKKQKLVLNSNDFTTLIQKARATTTIEKIVTYLTELEQLRETINK